MTATTPSTALATPAGLHRRRAASARRVPSRVPRPDSRGLHPGPAPVHRLVPHPLAAAVRGPPRGHRDLRPGTRSARPGPRHGHPAAVHHRRVLQVRRRRRAPRALPGRARPPTEAGLRVPCDRTGPQRARGAPGRRRARPARRARPHLAARAQRAARIGGHRRGHRAPGPGTRAPHPGHHPQGQQGGYHPACPAYRPGDRAGGRRARRRTAIPRWRRAAAGPVWRPPGSSGG
jgi:hypothetical protein